MFWNQRMASWVRTLDAFFKGDQLRLSDLIVSDKISPLTVLATCADSLGVVNLLNECFETNSRSTTAVTMEWFIQSILLDKAIWIVSKDRFGTVRGCICSRPSEAPYPNSVSVNWGIVDWYCVHPLWRSKGIGSALLETLDTISFRIGRKAHIFLKEGSLLLIPQIPVYTSFLYCRQAVNSKIHEVPKLNWIYPYMTKEKETGLPLLRIDFSQVSDSDLDTLLPQCIVFSSSYQKGWKRDTLVSIYAFRWIPGKWLGSAPHSSIF